MTSDGAARVLSGSLHLEPRALVLPRAVRFAVVAACLRALPEEGCGLLAGVAGTTEVERVFPIRNAAASAKLYALDARQHLLADRAAQDDGLQIFGVFHSHTHTDPYPSPTDVLQAPDPSWHYVIVSLRDEVPSLRSFQIVSGVVNEEPIVERA